jgi:hypothetical protein
MLFSLVRENYDNSEIPSLPSSNVAFHACGQFTHGKRVFLSYSSEMCWIFCWKIKFLPTSAELNSPNLSFAVKNKICGLDGLQDLDQGHRLCVRGHRLSFLQFLILISFLGTPPVCTYYIKYLQKCKFKVREYFS